MTPDDVTLIVDVFERSDVPFWVDGGWAVDALVGEHTREHDDLDVVVERADVDRARETLIGEGFRVMLGGEPWNFVMRDAHGREVDFHVVRFDALRNALYGPNGLMYPAGSLEGVGVIAGRRVRCATAEFLMESRTGYQPDLNDFHDVRLLHARFGVSVPSEYREKPPETSRSPSSASVSTTSWRLNDRGTADGRRPSDSVDTE